jgi:anti-anti-sigma regulatory factor
MGSVFLDCAPLEAPTAATINQIARLKLTALRRGCELELVNLNPHLRELIGLFGLSEVLRVESRGQAEEREQPCSIEEEGELDDPSLG